MITLDKEQFAAADSFQKWRTISYAMQHISDRENAFMLRRLFNPHHSKEQVEEEERVFRKSNLEAWQSIKELYAMFRDDMVNTHDQDNFKLNREILEHIFTSELEEAMITVASGNEE